MYIQETKQRPGVPIPVRFEPNLAGQGGGATLTLRTAAKWIVLHFETEEEVRELLSQAHIIHHNWSPKNA